MSSDLQTIAEHVVMVSRSKYQLEHFVIGQHDTPAMRWRQLMIETQDLLYKIKTAELGIEKLNIEIHRLLSTGDPIDAIDAEQKRLDAQITSNTLAGARVELQWLIEIAENSQPYTVEEIEADQPNYWEKRLNRQADLDRLAQIENVSSGNLAAMLQANILTYKQDQCAIPPGN